SDQRRLPRLARLRRGGPRFSPRPRQVGALSRAARMIALLLAQLLYEAPVATQVSLTATGESAGQVNGEPSQTFAARSLAVPATLLFGGWTVPARPVPWARRFFPGEARATRLEAPFLASAHTLERAAVTGGVLLGSKSRELYLLGASFLSDLDFASP